MSKSVTCPLQWIMWSRSPALVWWRPSIAGAGGRMRKCAVITLCMWTSPTGTTTSNKSCWLSLKKKVRDLLLLHYIYAFSRRFYPKRLTVHSIYNFFFLSLLHFLRLPTHNFWNYGSTNKTTKHAHSMQSITCLFFKTLIKTLYISTLTHASNDWPYTHQTTCFGLWVNCFTECASSTTFSVWEMIY